MEVVKGIWRNQYLHFAGALTICSNDTRDHCTGRACWTKSNVQYTYTSKWTQDLLHEVKKIKGEWVTGN